MEQEKHVQTEELQNVRMKLESEISVRILNMTFFG